ncbi:WD40 repeat domain-containing serine/threonine protein kinase [Zavarzinella formosa]|uniref:WD40 repeat domain-containing serine/threonine protein kinase n=1 Tax=Zavarzinella formosa TaxID=360055 RepID=UPI0003151E72|nr:WD40 repeat domain-containing serine/threonine-protein kinase [Zavarzinella formosa]
MNGDNPETKPATPPPGDPTGALPISSGDFPSITPPPLVMSHTTTLVTARPASAVPSTKPADIVPVHRRIGKYSLLKEIGRGGMGVVYLAHQDDLNRDVALKVIPSGPDADQTEVARFHAEAETAANLHHPNIVPVFDVGTADDLSYLAMELVEGGSLYKLISRKPLEPILAARLLEPVARAMHYAHLQGVIHRDLKPSNILLSDAEQRSNTPNGQTVPVNDHDLVPKIVDFGLAKRIHRPLALTQTGLAVGTPHYMAPEQALGKADQISPLTDVYALGAILYEMLTGHPPFGAGSSLETMQQVVSRKPVPPSSLRASIPRELEHICLKCLEKKQANRYPSALAVADALHTYMHRTEPPTILARTVVHEDSDPSLIVRRLGGWSFWPATVALVLLTGFLTWRITHRNWIPVQNELTDKLEERNRLAKFLQFENAVLLADRGDFDRIIALEPGQFPEHRSVLAEYRSHDLAAAPWARTIKARRVAFDYSGRFLMALMDTRVVTINAESGEVLNTSPLSEPEAGNRDSHDGYVIGRSRFTPLFAVVADPARLAMGNAAHQPLVEGNVTLPTAARLIQPLGDGSTILLSDGTDRWTVDFKTRKPVPVPVVETEPKFGKVLAISEQGKWLVESAEGWHVLPGAGGSSPVIPSPGVTTEVMFSPAGSHLSAILRNGAVRLFDFNEHRWFDLPADGVATAAGFSADGNILAVGTRAGTVRLWDAFSRARLSAAANLDKSIVCVDIAKNRQTVVVVTSDGTVSRFRFGASPFHAPVMRLENKPFKDVVDIAFSPNGDSLYVTTPYGLSRWTVRTATRQQFGGNQEIAATEEMMQSGRPNRRTPEFKAMAIRAPSARETGEQVLVGGVDGKMALLAVRPEGVTPQTQTEVEGGQNVTGVAFSPNGEKTVAVCDSEAPGEAFVKYWNSNFGTDPSGRKKSTRFPFRITAERFTPNGRHIAFGTDDGFVRLWDPEKPPDEFIREFKCDSRVICVTIDRDGELLLAGCADGNARIFEMQGGNLLRTLKHRTEVRRVAFHRDRPVTAAADGAIRIWHPQHDFTLGPPFRHGDAITAMSIRGDLLASSSRDRAIRVWNLPD